MNLVYSLFVNFVLVIALLLLFRAYGILKGEFLQLQKDLQVTQEVLLKYAKQKQNIMEQKNNALEILNSDADLLEKFNNINRNFAD